MSNIMALHDKAYDDRQKLKQDRDEAVALVEVMRERGEELISHTLDCEKQLDEFYGMGKDAGSGCSEAVTDFRSALSLTDPDAPREIQARTIEDAAERGSFGHDTCFELREMAAAKRKGE